MTRPPPRFNLTPRMKEMAAKWLARKKPKPRKAQRAQYAARMLERASDNMRKAGGLLAGKDGTTPPLPPAEFAPTPQVTEVFTHDATTKPKP